MEAKKILALLLSAAMVLSPMTKAQTVHAAEATTKIDDSGITIENDYLKREFEIDENGHILTSAVTNKRIDKTLNPGEGSEDFVINTLNPDVKEEEGGQDDDRFPSWIPGEAYDTADWSATLTNSAGTAFTDAMVAKLFDGNTSTYPDEYTKSGHPFTLDINFGEPLEISGMSVDKRPGYTQQAYGINGTMGGYEIWVKESADAEYTKISEGEFTEEDYNLHKEGNLYNVGDTVYAGFDTVTAQYVRVVQTSAALGTVAEFTSSEVDFYQTMEKPDANPSKVLDRANWKISIQNANGAVFSDAHAKRVIDGDLNTNPDEYTKSGNPFTMDIDMGEVKTIRSFSVDKRPGFHDANYGINGTLGEFELYVSTDGENYTLASQGNFVKEAYNLHSNEEGTLHNIGDRVYANLTEAFDARYVRLVQKSTSMGTSAEFTTAEFNLFEDKYYGTDWTTETAVKKAVPILSSELIYAGAEADSSVAGEEKVTISYEPYAVNGITYTIKQVVVLKGEDHYMRSFLEISVDNAEKAQIDYIDTDLFVLPEDAEGVWSHPDDSKISSMWIGQHELMLGQPIYVDGMFLGSEFPAADNIVTKANKTQIRYYSGKTFTKLAEDNQLTTDGKFVTWQNVIGAARGTETAVVQTDFFDYIEDIATPTEFRKQYNSWYDNMMSITDESIASSFNGAEKGLAENGVEPLDSYVVDDGWNNYYDGKFTGASQNAGSGTPNRTGFWEFNNKFPNELYTSSALTDKFQSSFGLWVGPQGGYNYFGGFAQFLESQGTGEVQNDYWTNICTGSRLYLKNFENRFTDYQSRFNIDYWKWDGFAVRPCTNANHHHMTGGDKNMYYTSDMWEAWTDLFENVRAARRAEGKDLFINATCYVNLSPWLLQWVNTIWVQDSGDTGQIADNGGERHQQKIYYRDQVYYQLYKQNEIQFPLKNIYNHDPIYGVSDESNATTEVFREFLFANAVRGTAFWELYYSPSIMDDAKWKVTADALAWAEENHDVLKNAKLFGAQPKKGVYGYSGWNGAEGVVSFTNPLNTAQEYTLAIDGNAGANEAVQNLAGVQVYPYAEGTLEGTLSYGDEVTVSLEPHQTIIYHYGHQDAQAPELLSAKSTGANELTLRFNERIQNAEFTVDGKDVNAELKEDFRTVVLATDKLQKDAQVRYSVKDFNHNEAKNTVTVAYCADGVIAGVADEKALKDAPVFEKSYDAVSDVMWLSGWDNAYAVDTVNELKGVEDFGIKMNVKTRSENVTLFDSNNGEVRLSINADGFVEFKVKDTVLSSREEVTTVTEKAHGTFGTDEYVPTATEKSVIGQVNDGKAHAIAASREANGMLKVYVDGRLAASVYDEAHLNEALAGGIMKVLDAGLEGQISEITVRNKAFAYDETEAVNEAVADTVAPSHEGWTATACSEMPGMSGDASAMAALDGNRASWWHTHYLGGDTCTDPHWIAVDFHKAETFDQFIYVGRGAGSNGSIKDYRLEFMDENGDYTVVKEGSFTAATAEDTIRLDKAYTAYGLRLTALSTHNGANFAAAVEVDIAAPDRELTEAELKERSEALLAKAGNLENYTAESVREFMPAYEKVQNVERASELTWAALEGEFNAAMSVLVEKEYYTAYVDGEAVAAGIYNTKAEVHADAAKDGKEFVCWMAGETADGRQTVVSMNRDYTFYLANNVYLTAVYGEEEATATASIVNAIAMPALSGKINARFVGQLAVPEGTKILDAGLVWSSKEAPAALNLDAAGAKVTHISKISNTNQFSVTINGVPEGRYVRGVIFAKVQLPNGTEETVIYSVEDTISNH